MRLRTINTCLLELKKLDPETPVSLWLIRKLSQDGCVRKIMSGNKTLVDLDDLIRYLNEANNV